MNYILFVGAILIAIPSSVFSQTALPESPAIWREVTGVTNSVLTNGVGSNPVHTRPHIPAFRTTADGRVGLRVKGSAEFCLMMPEKLTNFTLLNPASSRTMSATNYEYLDGYSLGTISAHATNFYNAAPGDGNISHCALYDPTPAINVAGVTNNPTVVNGEDVYNLKVLAIFSYSALPNRVQLFVTPVRVAVTNAKTSSAFISSITKSGPTVGGPVFTFGAEMFEPVIVGDGRLLILRVSGASLPWYDPDLNTNRQAQSTDIAYSYYVDDGTTNTAPANPLMWTNLIPITHAPFDSRINQKFGFAMAPFRDADGKLIPDGEDLEGTYPWMDRHAKNLFFTSVGDTLHYSVVTNGVTNWTNSRYEQTGTPGETPNYTAGEDGGNTRGVCFLGLWSHGKMVMIDNLNNDMDYAVGDASFPSGSERMVHLFETNSGPFNNESGWIRLGAGRANNRLPSGDNINTTIIDSLENIFNYQTFAVPLTIRDVVWTMSNGKQTDDLAFDDYVDPDGFIVANMAGVASYDFSITNTTAKKSFAYRSGWNTTNKQFNLPVWLQNAATATTNRWIIPAHGLLTGGGRLEPAATGGFYGKGLWLTGSNGLQFSITNQPQNVLAKDWYVGVFVDCRFVDDATERTLLTFPDTSSIWLRGRNQVLYRDANGTVLNRVVLPTLVTNAPPSALDDLFPDRDWAHLGFQIRKSGSEVDLHLDGLLYNRWSDQYSSLFHLTPGTLTLGQTNVSLTNGFRGWVDDFKIFAHAVDFETACNHAGGTLIGLPSTYTNEWKTRFADRYPQWAHDEISTFLRNQGETNFPRYASFHDYRADKGAHLGNLPAGTISLRKSVHFPEGPLFHNAPRPHSAANSFCLTCHVGGADGGLDLTAITLDTPIASQDDRRQPMQPFRRVFGKIPAGLVPATGLPTVATNLPYTGQVIDVWTLPTFSNSVAVRTFTLLNAGTQQDLLSITNGTLVDPARLGTTNFTIRANLDSAQGSVVMKLDAGATNNKSRPPFTLLGTTNSPYVGTTFSAGLHSVVATPSFGLAVTQAFNMVTANTARVVAGYRDDFRPFSPTPGWTYEWNAAGSVSNRANYHLLNWSPALNLYSANGTPARPDNSSDFGWGRLTSTSGNPGNGAAQAGGFDRYAIAAYQAKWPGYYAITNGFVTVPSTNGNGGQLLIFTDTNGGTNFTKQYEQFYPQASTLNFMLNVGYLTSGDTIYVCFGPNGNTGSDAFNLDFKILFKENGNPF